MGLLWRVDVNCYDVRSPACAKCPRFLKLALKERSRVFRALNSLVNPLFDKLLERLVPEEEQERSRVYAEQAMAGTLTEEESKRWAGRDVWRWNWRK